MPKRPGTSPEVLEMDKVDWPGSGNLLVHDKRSVTGEQCPYRSDTVAIEILLSRLLGRSVVLRASRPLIKVAMPSLASSAPLPRRRLIGLRHFN